MFKFNPNETAAFVYLASSTLINSPELIEEPAAFFYLTRFLWMEGSYLELSRNFFSASIFIKVLSMAMMLIFWLIIFSLCIR